MKSLLFIKGAYSDFHAISDAGDCSVIIITKGGTQQALLPCCSPDAAIRLCKVLRQTEAVKK